MSNFCSSNERQSVVVMQDGNGHGAHLIAMSADDPSRRKSVRIAFPRSHHPGHIHEPEIEVDGVRWGRVA